MHQIQHLPKYESESNTVIFKWVNLEAEVCTGQQKRKCSAALLCLCSSIISK